MAGFVVIGFSHVKALRDFASMGGLGLTGAFLCAITLLPAILVLLDRAPARANSRPRLSAERLLPAIARWRMPLLFACVAIFAGSLIVLALPGQILPLESDLSVMHPRPNAPLDAQDKIAARMGMSPGALVLHLEASDDAKLIQLAHEAATRLQRNDVHETGITGTLGLATVLPDPTIAQARIATTGEALAKQVITDFHAALAESIFDPMAFKDYENFLHQLLTATKPPQIADLLRYPRLAELVLSTSATREHAAPTEAITLLFPP